MSSAMSHREELISLNPVFFQKRRMMERMCPRSWASLVLVSTLIPEFLAFVNGFLFIFEMHFTLVNR